ncbi:MAG: hypothetical protein AB7J32_13720 [Pseudonocardia sp.]
MPVARRAAGLRAGGAPPVPEVAAHLAPFIAWLATREPDVGLRRRYHAHVEDYLRDVVPRSCPEDPVARLRYESALAVPATRRTEIRGALDRFAEYRGSGPLAPTGPTASVSDERAFPTPPP